MAKNTSPHTETRSATLSDRDHNGKAQHRSAGTSGAKAKPGSPLDYVRHFVMPAQEDFKESGRWRLLGAAVIAVACIVAIMVLGPDRDEIKKRFEFVGAEGPMEIMPDLSIEPGHDTRHQEPKYYQNTPPPPQVEVIPDLTPEAKIKAPPPLESTVESEIYADLSTDPDLDLVDQVEMQLPQQTHPCFVLLRQIRPQYPSNATEQQRRIPLIIVEVAFFVNPEGKVTASMIQSSNGGPIFNDIVLKAVKQWLYKPIECDVESPLGFWNTLTIRFKSPYGPS